MARQSRKIDYLHDSPLRVIASVAFPLIVVYLVQTLVTALTNELYSSFVGPVAFSVTGYLNPVIAAFINVVNSMASAAWIKTARFFGDSDRSAAEREMISGFYTIVGVELIGAVLLLLFTNPMMAAMSVPAEIEREARLYYVLYIATYLPAPIAAYFLTVINGTGSSMRIFLVNMYVVLVSGLTSVLMLAVAKTGVVGMGLLPMINAVLQLVLYVILLRKDGFTFKYQKRDLKPDFLRILRIARYGFVIALQIILCTAGGLAATIQANKYLPLEYISVLNIGLPIVNAMVALATTITVFCPRNYDAKAYDRIKKFLRLSLLIILVYGLICFAVYATLGEWYYGRMFDDPQIIQYGKDFWFWTGLGYMLIAFIYIFRFFFDAIGMGKLSLLSGLGELVGNSICAFWLIPKFGVIGRSLTGIFAWGCATIALLTAYFVFRKRIYKQ